MRKIIAMVAVILIVCVSCNNENDSRVNLSTLEENNVSLYNALKLVQSEGAFSDQDFLVIESLDLSGRNLDSIEGLDVFINLKELNISDNILSSLEPLSELSTIERLDISGNSIDNFTPILNLPNLKYVDLSSNTVNIYLDTSVRELSFSAEVVLYNDGEIINNINPIIKDFLYDNYSVEEPITYYDVKNIDELSIRNSELNALNGIEYFTGLKELNLYGNNISDIKDHV